MYIHIHPAEDRDAFIDLALELFLRSAAETIFNGRTAAEPRHAS